ncbi:hypothetical protein ACQJBY_072580 [Aegilops geniculata]
MALLPSCIALRSQSNGSYLRYVQEQGETYRQLQLNGKDTNNPYTRYDVQLSQRHQGLVHIRCRYNRKYWVARRRGDGWCMAADADEPEEDLTDPNCTLIKPIVTTATDDGGESVMTVRFVGAGDDKVTQRMTFSRDDAAPCMRVVESEATDHDEDAFTVLNLVNSSRLLPKLVMFKDKNNRFLASRRTNDGRVSILQFGVTDIGDGSARFELFPRDDGSLCIANNSPGRGTGSSYWNLADRTGGWISSSMAQTSAATNRSAWFRVHQVNDAFAISSVQSGRFCKGLTMNGYRDCLNAADTTVTADARFAVEEPILLREIHSIDYKLHDARVYDTTVLTMATTAAVNDTSTENTKRLRLEYEEEEMNTWDSTAELKLGYNSKIRAGFPKLGLGATVSVSAEFFGAYNWGETMEKKVKHEVVYVATVPPRTKVTIMAIAARSAVDVPFTYWQRDVHIDGKVEQVFKEDGLFTGINSYNFNFQTVEEKLPERETIIVT